MTHRVICADAIDFLNSQPADSLDLVFGSPPYERARLYLEGGRNLGIARSTDEWVDWMRHVFEAAQRACKGLVAFVVAGQTRDFEWSAGPALLLASLRNRGMNLRNPVLYHRVGIPGSGGPDWLRNDYEWIVCTSRAGKLPWSDNTAMGHAPKWAPGGEMSHRLANGQRVNQWGTHIDAEGKVSKGGQDGASGKRAGRVPLRPSHKVMTKKREGQHSQESTSYDPPALANPGNVIHCTVGGGQMGGDAFASQNEAPFPERLPEFFVRSFCPPGGTVCDPFCGSGTTPAVAVRWGRNFTGCDLRQSQVDLTLRRIAEEIPMLFPEGG